MLEGLHNEKQKEITLTVRITAQTKKELDEIAKREGVTVSALVRYYLANFSSTWTENEKRKDLYIKNNKI